MLNLSLHHQVELGKLRGFGSDEFQETALGNHQDVWETRWEALEFEGTKRSIGELNRWPGDFSVRNFVKFLGETDLIQDFEDGWMNRVSAEFAVEVLVHFEKRYRNAATREE